MNEIETENARLRDALGDANRANARLRAEVECWKWSLERRESELSKSNLQKDELLKAADALLGKMGPKLSSRASV